MNLKFATQVRTLGTRTRHGTFALLESFDKFVLSGAYYSKIYTVPPGLNCPANISPTDVVVVDGPEITKLLRWSTCVLDCFT